MSEHRGYIDDKGLLVVISGFSGAGKSVLTKKLLENSDRYAYSVSATTRQPRNGEVNGKDYSFITKDAFEHMIENGELLEYNRYVDNYYGTPRKYVLEQIEKGKDVILEIDVNGARQVKQSYPEAITIFVTAPGAKELERRLSGRGTENRDVIKKRLTAALKEADDVRDYDFIIINDDLEKTAAHLNSLIEDQHMRVSRQGAYLDRFKEEMKDILEEY